MEIRNANIKDASLILTFIEELAEYEKAAEEVVATISDIEQSLFGSGTTTKALICSIEGRPIGYAVYFFNYSTWLGKHGLYLEDLFITQRERGNGAGKKLLKYLANIAIAKGCGRFEWSVLHWNEPAIHFYRSIGARPQDEWVNYRLNGEALKKFAKS